MRRLAILLWGVAAVLALVIGWQGRERQERGVTALMPAPELLLWRSPVAAVAPDVMPSAPPETASAAAEALPATDAAVPAPAVTACARLGIFPDADWAEQVGLVLLPRAEQGGASWVVKAYPRHRYYVVFSGLGQAALALRLEAHRPALRRRVSASAHPEACF